MFHKISLVAFLAWVGLGADGLSTLGLGGMLLLCAKAYSRGAGTYTGIEAVSNGLQLIREPRVPTGKRTMLYMALDSWLPHRFSSLSERLTTHCGVGLMAAASVAALLYAHGHIDTLVTMYSINVFVTFSLTQMGMVRFWILRRGERPEWKRALSIHLVGLALCLGIHALLNIQRQFPGYFKQVVFVSIAVVDSGVFKGAAEIDACKKATQDDLDRFVDFARSHGLAATSATDTGTDPVETAEAVCAKLCERFSQPTFFAGRLIFQRDKWYQRILHNETACAIQRRLQWRGLATVVLPIRVTA